nr:hypothetical protein [Francisella persica]
MSQLLQVHSKACSILISAYVGQCNEVIMLDPIFDTYTEVTKFNQGKCVRLKLLPNGNIDTNAIVNAIYKSY